MAHRINERNIGNYTLDGELKIRRTKYKKISRSFTENEIRLFEYLLGQIEIDIHLDTSDYDDQVYRDSGNILIQFSRDDISDFRSLINKFQK